MNSDLRRIPQLSLLSWSVAYATIIALVMAMAGQSDAYGMAPDRGQAHAADAGWGITQLGTIHANDTGKPVGGVEIEFEDDYVSSTLAKGSQLFRPIALLLRQIDPAADHSQPSLVKLYVLFHSWKIHIGA